MVTSVEDIMSNREISSVFFASEYPPFIPSQAVIIFASFNFFVILEYNFLESLIRKLTQMQ